MSPLYWAFEPECHSLGLRGLLGPYEGPILLDAPFRNPSVLGPEHEEHAAPCVVFVLFRPLPKGWTCASVLVLNLGLVRVAMSSCGKDIHVYIHGGCD